MQRLSTVDRRVPQQSPCPAGGTLGTWGHATWRDHTAAADSAQNDEFLRFKSPPRSTTIDPPHARTWGQCHQLKRQPSPWCAAKGNAVKDFGVCPLDYLSRHIRHNFHLVDSNGSLMLLGSITLFARIMCGRQTCGGGTFFHRNPKTRTLS